MKVVAICLLFLSGCSRSSPTVIPQGESLPLISQADCHIDIWASQPGRLSSEKGVVTVSAENVYEFRGSVEWEEAQVGDAIIITIQRPGNRDKQAVMASCNAIIESVTDGLAEFKAEIALGKIAVNAGTVSVVGYSREAESKKEFASAKISIHLLGAK